MPPFILYNYPACIAATVDSSGSRMEFLIQELLEKKPLTNKSKQNPSPAPEETQQWHVHSFKEMLG